MFFMLGVLVATLVALMVLPAIWHRAVRLTTRRIEAAVPTSIFEIHADKDLQRAGFALNQRRLEIQIEALRDQLMRGARTLEEHRLEAIHIGEQLAIRTGEHAALSAERDALATQLAETHRALEDRIATLAEASVALAARDAELQAANAALGETQRLLSAQEERSTSLSAVLLERETQLAQARAETVSHQTALSDTLRQLEAVKAGTAAQMEALLLKLSAAETAAEAAGARLVTLTQSGASAEDLSLVRTRLTEIAERIAAATAVPAVPALVEHIPLANGEAAGLSVSDVAAPPEKPISADEAARKTQTRATAS